MKIIFKILFIIILGQVFNLNAQSKEKKYSFSVYISNGTARSECLDIKKVYVSPIVSHHFDNYESSETANMELSLKWSKKCQAKFGITKTYCWGTRYNSWSKNRSDIDEERDKVIVDLRRQGYSVKENYLFSFYFN